MLEQDWKIKLQLRKFFMKIYKHLIREYRKNPSAIRGYMRELRDNNADNECIKCHLVTCYIPKIARNVFLTGMGVAVVSSLTRIINELTLGNQVIDQLSLYGNLLGVITILNVETLAPIEKWLRKRLGPQLKCKRLETSLEPTIYEENPFKNNFYLDFDNPYRNLR